MKKDTDITSFDPETMREKPDDAIAEELCAAVKKAKSAAKLTPSKLRGSYEYQRHVALGLLDAMEARSLLELPEKALETIRTSYKFAARLTEIAPEDEEFRRRARRAKKLLDDFDDLPF